MLGKEEIEIIDRYIKGISDEEENKFIESLFSNGNANNSLRMLLEADWNNSIENSDNDISHILDRVHHIIRKQEIIESKKPARKFLNIYMKIAAVLFLPLLIIGGLATGLQKNRENVYAENMVSSTIFAPLGSRVAFNLPDGTTGMLNSGSKLTYSIPFNNSRHISLEGEAWFDVMSDKSHPFEISTGNSMVKVLGTSFNLSAYPAENYVELVLKKGIVEFTNKESAEVITILPSERLIMRQGNIAKTTADPSKYNAWIEGKLIFRGDPMAEVARRIERWYNVEVVLADKELEKYSFRATFEDDKLINVLKLLSLTSPIRYEITPSELTSDGICKKEKVIIYMKKDS